MAKERYAGDHALRIRVLPELEIRIEEVVFGVRLLLAVVFRLGGRG